MEIKLNRDKCIACGQCYLHYPEIYDCDDEGIAYVREAISSQDKLQAQESIYLCPTRAIYLNPDSA